MNSSDPQGVPPLSHPPPTASPPERSRLSIGQGPSLSHPEATDSVTLSDQRKEHQTLTKLIDQLPDIRQERIDQIREALKSGKNSISSEQIADQIIQDTALNHSTDKS